MSLRIIARDPIQMMNTTKLVESTLFNGQTDRLSFYERQALAYEQPVYYSQENDMKKVGIARRGLLNSVSTSGGIWVPPMIQNNQQLVKLYTRPVSGTASNPRLNQERLAVGNYIMANAQSVHSGRLY
jgi:hypothetical protein